MHDQKHFFLKEDQESGQRTSRKHPICNLKVQRGFAMRHLTRSPSRKWGTPGLFLSATASQTLREKRRCPPSFSPPQRTLKVRQPERPTTDRSTEEREGRKEGHMSSKFGLEGPQESEWRVRSRTNPRFVGVSALASVDVDINLVVVWAPLSLSLSLDIFTEPQKETEKAKAVAAATTASGIIIPQCHRSTPL